MKEKRNGLLLQTKKQMNNGAIATGLGFVLYMVLLVLGLELAADLVAAAFSVVGIYVSLSVLPRRRPPGGVPWVGGVQSQGAFAGDRAPLSCEISQNSRRFLGALRRCAPSGY